MDYFEENHKNVSKRRLAKAVSVVRRASAELEDLHTPQSALRAFVPVAVTVLAIAGLALNVTSSSASNPPTIEFFQSDVEAHATWAFVSGAIESFGSPANWRLESATAASGPWTDSGTGTVDPGHRGDAVVFLHHLTPTQRYYVRLVAENASGNTTSKVIDFSTTPVGPPAFLETNCLSTEIGFKIGFNSILMCGHVHTQSTDLIATIEAEGAETHYVFEYSRSDAGPWTMVSSSEGFVTTVEDYALTSRAELTGLSPETEYYVRVAAINEKGTTFAIVKVKTKPVHPEASVNQSVKISGTSAHVGGSVYAGTLETQWRFEYATSEGGPWTAAPGASGTISTAEAGEESHKVEADVVGLAPSTTYYVRLVATNVNGTATSSIVSFATGGAPEAETFAVHALHGEAVRVLGAVVPHGFDTHYHFEFVPREEFEEAGWSSAQSTSQMDAGVGEQSGGVFPTVDVGQDLPALQAGTTYVFRLVATNEVGTVEGKVRSITAPTPVAAGKEACSEDSRSPLSGLLPDCRAYEQLTPVDKDGAFEAFPVRAGAGIAVTGALIGEDGEHLMVEASRTFWGTGQGPYAFARGASGWQMTATAAQPETGVYVDEPQVYSPNLTNLGFATSFATMVGSESPNIEFKVGPPGGPYTTVAAVPRAQVDVSEGNGWVAASADFSKLILEVRDHRLLGHPTGTTSPTGADLYEYSNGQLAQVNVLTDGSPISSCGAQIAHGSGEVDNHSSHETGSPHSVSANGSRVFFTDDCTHHLYVRVNGGETLDLGEYSVVAANSDGSRLLVERQTGTARELVLYDVETQSAKSVVTVPDAAGRPESGLSFSISEDFNVVWITTYQRLTSEAPLGYDLYRYEIPTGTLRFVVSGALSPTESSSDGRYLYFTAAEVGGVPGGRRYEGLEKLPEMLYRYDNSQDMVECVSCASSFDPEPRLPIKTAGESALIGRPPSAGLPRVRTASDNGDYAFFETTAALVPQDLNGEFPGNLNIIKQEEEGGESPSWDVYEWRRDGLGRCDQVQGCISLITPGTDGGEVGLIGTTASGRDVFLTTQSQLLPTDKDTSGDVYDARVGGGFQMATAPVECEGDACSTPLSAPVDLTPSSLSFVGSGNPAPTSTGNAVGKRVHRSVKKKRKGGRKRVPRKSVRRIRTADGRGHGGAR